MDFKISFIIVNYNTREITTDCINSLKLNEDLKRIPYEVIIVDNNSSDGSVQYFEKIVEENIHIISNNMNHGFGKANNIGVREAKGEYVILLNSDTLAHQTDFNSLISVMNEKVDIGILSIKILNKDSSIQSLGFNFPTLLNEIKLNLLFWNYNQIKKIRFRNYKNKGLYDVDWVSGCFILMRKRDYISVKGFDEKIFMYAEDLDLCYKIVNQGKRICIYDMTSIFHLHGISSNKKKIKLTNLLKRRENYYYVIKKHNLISILSLQMVKATYLINAIFTLGIKNLSLRRKFGK